MAPDTWHVPSSSGVKPDGYLVTKVKEECCECAGQPTHALCTRKECIFLCWHMYACDQACYDYNNGHVCKHIHRVHSARIHLQASRQVADVPDSMNVSSFYSFSDAPDDDHHSPKITYTAPSRNPCTGRYLTAELIPIQSPGTVTVSETQV